VSATQTGTRRLRPGPATVLISSALIVLAQVPSKHAKNPPTKSIPQAASAVPAAEATTNGHSPAYATDG
jgi:hypothetical protein